MYNYKAIAANNKRGWLVSFYLRTWRPFFACFAVKSLGCKDWIRGVREGEVVPENFVHR
jgi:hypothetical protein